MSLIEKAPPPSPVGIVGSRTYPDLRRVVEFVQSLPKGTQVVTGGAPGIDRTAYAATRRCPEDLPTPAIFPADWQRHGKAAGHIRNDQVIRFLVENSGCLVAFWDGASPGTKSMIEKATKAGILYEVYDSSGNPMSIPPTPEDRARGYREPGRPM